MRRGIEWGVLVLALCAAPGGAAPARTAPPRTEPAAYYVVDAATGTVLAEKDAHKRWPPASMTKMMTVLLAMERVRAGGLALDERVPVSEWASKIGGSQVFLAPGETFTLRELLQAVMIASANDAAVAVAEYLAGSQTEFVRRMNERAKSLGLADTVYETPHGLPPEPGRPSDVSSAFDLARLGRELMQYPEAMEWARTPAAGFRNDTFQMMNTNHLVRGTFAGATGLKTGYHQGAGFCVTASATRGDLSLVAVVLGLPTKEESFAQAARLMNEAFAGYRVLVAARRATPVGEVAVSGGDAQAVHAITQDDFRLLIKRADDHGVMVEARIPRLVAAPVRRLQPLGDVVVRRGDDELARIPVVADQDVAATGWLAWWWNRSQ